jgi:hypothetical protein
VLGLHGKQGIDLPLEIVGGIHNSRLSNVKGGKLSE